MNRVALFFLDGDSETSWYMWSSMFWVGYTLSTRVQETAGFQLSSVYNLCAWWRGWGMENLSNQGGHWSVQDLPANETTWPRGWYNLTSVTLAEMILCAPLVESFPHSSTFIRHMHWWWLESRRLLMTGKVNTTKNVELPALFYATYVHSLMQEECYWWCPSLQTFHGL